MLDNPGLDPEALSATLARHYDLEARAVTFLPVGYDPHAAAYRVDAISGPPFFLKVRFAPLHEPALRVPRALLEAGIANVVAPLRSISWQLWAPVHDHQDVLAVLYPFVDGESAASTGLTDEQWREFGMALRAVHDCVLDEGLQARLPQETFSLPSAAIVRELLHLVRVSTYASPAAANLARFYRENTSRVTMMIERAEAMGNTLRSTSRQRVLCHADIHLANVMVGRDGRLWLVDWDGPLLAPPERDLLFIVGSRIVRPVCAQQEDRFFEGYGPSTINPLALSYFRYERILEDLGAFGQSVLLNPALSETARTAEVELAIGFFDSGGDIDRAEQIPRWRWPHGGT